MVKLLTKDGAIRVFPDVCRVRVLHSLDTVQMYLLAIGVFSLKKSAFEEWRGSQRPRPLVSFHLLSRFLSPLERGAFDSLAVSVDARRARVQLDKQLGEFELGKHRLQEALQENVDQAAVHGLVLKHVENTEDALPGGVCADDVLQLV